MGNKILSDSKNATVEELVKKINDVVKENNSLIEEKYNLEKWNTVPKLLLLDHSKKKKVLSFVELLDSLFISLEDKILYLISLSGLLEYGKIKLDSYDEGSIFTMVDYYKACDAKYIKNTIMFISNPKLLLAVRKKTLDLEVRCSLLSDIVARSKQLKIGTEKDFIKILPKIIKELEEKDYYDLVKR